MLRSRGLEFAVLRRAAASAAAALLFVFPHRAFAQLEFDPFGMAGQRYELWAGGDTTGKAHSFYAGAIWAPFGSIRQDGWRVRTSSGRGLYGYESADGSTVGLSAFSDLLVGYRATFGNLTVKAYAGAAADYHFTDPFDPDNALDGLAIGPKLVLETWANLTPNVWAAIDLAWTKAHATHSTRARLGWRLLPFLSLGAEAGTFGNLEGDGGRYGAFARFEWADGELSLSGGRSGNLRAPDAPYGSVNLTTKF